jgi:phage terminase large subunit-like protein
MALPEKEIKQIEKRAHAYMDDVLSGRLPACRFVRMACKRHLDDLVDGPKRGLVFHRDRAAKSVKFFSFLKLWKGKAYRGKEFVLAPHYVFITWVLMGWYRKDGTRRFRKAYVEMGRKGAKSTYAGGLGSYFFIADGEYGAEIYCAAVKRDQAKIVWDNIKNLTRTSYYARKINYLTNNLSIEETMSKCEPLASDAKSLDGLDTHFATLDELHAHPTREVHDLIDDSIGARSQPLVLIITTAGFNQEGVCYETRGYVAQILRGVIQDDSVFGIIFTLDMKKDWADLKERKIGEKNPKLKKGEVLEDDWTDEENWIKACPGLVGITLKGTRYGIDSKGKPIPGYMTSLEDIRNKARIALQLPSAQNNFLTKRLNIWTQQEIRWIDLAVWDRNNVRPIDEQSLYGRECYGGIDLSSVSDLTVWSMLFPDPKNKDFMDVLVRIWCPKARLYDVRNKYREQYQSWEKQGFLLTTEGDAIDYDFVRSQIVKDNENFRINSISVDRAFQGYEFSINLNKELGGKEKRPKVFACGMGYLSMAGPCNEFERLLLVNGLNNGGNPVLRWMADNVSVSMDPAGNKKPNKEKSQGKIDGIVGILLGLDRILRQGAATFTSVYGKRGVRTAGSLRGGWNEEGEGAGNTTGMLAVGE